MDPELTTILREIADQLRLRNEEQTRFQERVVEELRRLNRNLEKMVDRDTGGPI
jgi:hypothetical protein